MLIIVLLLITGFLLGLSIGKISSALRLNEGTLAVTIYLSLLMLAFLAGVDDMIVSWIDRYGWTEFFLILVIVALVGLIGWIIVKHLSKKPAEGKLFTTGNGKIGMN